MEKIIEYLKQNIDSKSCLVKWETKDKLNFYIAGCYDYYKVQCLDNEFLLLKPLKKFSATRMKDQMEYIEKETKFDTALLLESTSAYQVKKLLEERISFISCNKQMYLPFMALHIRKNKKSNEPVKKAEKFTALTQLIFLYVLYKEDLTFTVEELVEKLKISAMSAKRGTDELEDLGLVDFTIGGKTGRKKFFTAISKKQFYEKGKQYLCNPVKKVIYVKELPSDAVLYKSGLYALSTKTMLAEPEYESYAVNAEKEKLFDLVTVPEIQAKDEGWPEIHVMKYDIGLLTKDDCIDAVTLIKSLEVEDERMEIAIEEMMEEYNWYEG